MCMAGYTTYHKNEKRNGCSVVMGNANGSRLLGILRDRRTDNNNKMDHV